MARTGKKKKKKKGEEEKTRDTRKRKKKEKQHCGKSERGRGHGRARKERPPRHRERSARGRGHIPGERPGEKTRRIGSGALHEKEDAQGSSRQVRAQSGGGLDASEGLPGGSTGSRVPQSCAGGSGRGEAAGEFGVIWRETAEKLSFSGASILSMSQQRGRTADPLREDSKEAQQRQKTEATSRLTSNPFLLPPAG